MIELISMENPCIDTYFSYANLPKGVFLIYLYYFYWIIPCYKWQYFFDEGIYQNAILNLSLFYAENFKDFFLGIGD